MKAQISTFSLVFPFVVAGSSGTIKPQAEQEIPWIHDTVRQVNP